MPTFAKTMSHFRDVSTEPPRQPPIRPPSPEENPGSSSIALPSDNPDPLGNISKSVNTPNLAERLKVLPAIVHRGPGTLHLTLGVMDLAKAEEMQKAVDLLASIDVQQMLKDAEKGPPPGMKSLRKWKEVETAPVAMTNEAEHPKVDSGTVDAEASAGPEKAVTSPDAKLQSLKRPVSPPATARPQHASDQPKPLYLSLTGIDAFTSVKKARVIWAKPRAQRPPATCDNVAARPTFETAEAERLYNLALHLQNAFRSAGLINETTPLALHATLANMRYKTQAKGGRTSKGKAWTHGKKRWQDGQVDIRALARVFNECDGDMKAAEAVLHNTEVAEDVQESAAETEDEDAQSRTEEEVERRDATTENPEKEYIWCRDIAVDRVAICKMGATRSEDPMWKEWYPPVAQRFIHEGM